jgi:hypothetical protein
MGLYPALLRLRKGSFHTSDCNIRLFQRVNDVEGSNPTLLDQGPVSHISDYRFSSKPDRMSYRQKRFCRTFVRDIVNLAIAPEVEEMPSYPTAIIQFLFNKHVVKIALTTKLDLSEQEVCEVLAFVVAHHR